MEQVRGIWQPLKCPRSVTVPESTPSGGVVSGLCTEQGSGDREVTEEEGPCTSEQSVHF